ncbi:lytic transglycosylase domain-containing protein [Catellatospora tritici]|uniref:aggregation-promoting factor C-terminal-like domain-containing protein n=1 Tax=Catellatospora tritici TaxID=2851566 RepID=UPI001C2DC8E4|nr:lytic transglycosylase domain-containing protein [Catellatospora tritici]MBV1849093.1 lytic transglycosylase domain-containing protein [Catellatospora tritici]
MSTPRTPFASHRRREPFMVHSRKIAIGALCAALLGFGGYRLAADDTTTVDLASRDAAAQQYSRDFERGLAPTPSLTASPTPTVTPSPRVLQSAPAVTRSGPSKPTPTVKRSTPKPTPKASTPKPTSATPSSCKAYTGNQLTACKLLPSFGFAYSQMPPLVQLWNHESGWNARAENKGSGAYGIPQALPGSKMAKFGDDWKTNAATQIKWGLDYIKNRYKTPSGAWSHFQNNNWY